MGVSQVSLTIENVDTDAGTLDINMTNTAGCSYCDDPNSNTQALCESVEGATWTFDANMSQSECCEAYPEDLVGVCADDGLAFDCPDGVCDAWFDGEVKGFQFYIKGLTITDVSGGTAEEYLDLVTFYAPTGKVFGLSTGTSVIPAGSAVLTTISFSDAGDGICFVGSGCVDDYDNDPSTPKTIEYNVDSASCEAQDGVTAHNTISDINGLLVDTDWGGCFCVADTEEDANGIVIGDGVCDTDDNCPAVVNPNQLDTDGDGAGDLCDTTCPYDENDDAGAEIGDDIDRDQLPGIRVEEGEPVEGGENGADPAGQRQHLVHQAADERLITVLGR